MVKGSMVMLLAILLSSLVETYSLLDLDGGGANTDFNSSFGKTYDVQGEKKTYSMKNYGYGYCKNGYVRGWDGKGLGSQDACNTVCLEEADCTFAAWYKDKTCSRYNQASCDLNNDKNHFTFEKTGGDSLNSKRSNVRLIIHNRSKFSMTRPKAWFDSGRLADSYHWPEIIKPNEQYDILMYERDWAFAGCSGFVTYTMGVDLIPFTIAFSNPYAGCNKLGVGTTGKGVWDDMSNHDYMLFNESFRVDGVKLVASCICTGGITNVAEVHLKDLGFSNQSEDVPTADD